VLVFGIYSFCGGGSVSVWSCDVFEEEQCSAGGEYALNPDPLTGRLQNVPPHS